MYNKIIYNLSKFMRALGFDFNEMSNVKIQQMNNEIKNIGGNIGFEVKQQADGNWCAVSTNIDGIITGGDDIREMNDFIKDAIFTYFEVPAYLCNDLLLKNTNETLTAHQKVCLA